MHPSGTRISCRIASIAPPSRRKASTSGSAWDKAAKAKGIYHGRKPSVPVERVREMRAAAHGPTAIGKAFGTLPENVHHVSSDMARRLGPIFRGLSTAGGVERAA
jgi:hypothetical protein